MIARMLCVLIVGLIVFVCSGTGYFVNPKPGVFILGGDMGQSGQNYDLLIGPLNEAQYGDKIYILIEDNGGGWTSDGDRIHKAIRNSKAIVTTESSGEASSAALHVLFAGDYIRVPKDKSIHVAHLKFVGNMNWPIRFWYNIEAELEHLAYYRKFMSTLEWDRFKKGENVWLSGAGICASAPKKVVDDNQHCVIDNSGER